MLGIILAPVISIFLVLLSSISEELIDLSECKILYTHHPGSHYVRRQEGVLASTSPTLWIGLLRTAMPLCRLKSPISLHRWRYLSPAALSSGFLDLWPLRRRRFQELKRSIIKVRAARNEFIERKVESRKRVFTYRISAGLIKNNEHDRNQVDEHLITLFYSSELEM